MSDSDDSDYDPFSDTDSDSEAASEGDVSHGSDGVASGDDASQGGIGFDYNRYFDNILRAFDSVDAAFQHANKIASDHGFWLVKASNYTGDDGRVRNFVKCDRNGVYVRKENPNTPSPRKNTSSKKCGCNFAIKIVEGYRNRGTFGIVHIPGRGTHNHEFLPYLDGHRRKSTLTPELKQLVFDEHEAKVAPRHIRLCLDQKLKRVHGNDACAPKMKSIYNMTGRHSAESRGSRNRGQEMLNLARENGYIYFFELDDDGSLSRIFMCHPEAAKMYRAWPYVVVMDSTYKTNKYQLPVVEMIGVSPVGNNFLITYAVLNNETKESYEWMLRRLVELLPPGFLPTTTVTDRELGLIAAIEAVFGNDVNHFLCTWHIYNAVETYALSVFKKNRGASFNCAHKQFGNMVDASTITEFRRAWQSFQDTYANRAGVVRYVRRTWLGCKKKWARCYTNKVLHFGTTATSRVEAAHAVFKTWSHSSTIGCDTLWKSADAMIRGQHAQLRSELSDSAGTSLAGWAGAYARLFTDLSGKVSKLGILRMKDEYDRGVSLGVGLFTDCGCSLRKTHGLPCACQLHIMDNMGAMVELDDVHPFWKTIVYGDHPVAEFGHREQMREMFDEISDMDPAMFQGVRWNYQRHVHPEREDIQEPRVAETRKGRPRTSTTRNRSHVEHARRHARETAPPVLTEVNYPHVAQAPQELGYITTADMTRVPNYKLLSSWLGTFYEAYFDPAADGHCGFRCLSHAVNGQDSDWMTMRRAMREEMLRRQFYPIIYGEHFAAHLERVRWNIPGSHCGQAHWMHGLDLFAFATLHSWTVCVVVCDGSGEARNWNRSCTYLPVYAPSDVGGPLGELWLLLYENHWRRIRLSQDAPMPPVNQLWSLIGGHDESVAHWPAAYYDDRIEHWMEYLPQT